MYVNTKLLFFLELFSELSYSIIYDFRLFNLSKKKKKCFTLRWHNNKLELRMLYIA